MIDRPQARMRCLMPCIGGLCLCAALGCSSHRFGLPAFVALGSGERKCQQDCDSEGCRQGCPIGAKARLKHRGDPSCDDDVAGDHGGQGDLGPALSRFHPVPTHPVFGYLSEYDPPPLHVVPAPSDGPQPIAPPPDDSFDSPQLPGPGPIEPEEARAPSRPRTASLPRPRAR